MNDRPLKGGHRVRLLLLLILALASCSTPPVPAAPAPEGASLSVDRIFGSREFSGEGASVHWEARGATYVTVERSCLVRHDVATDRSEVLVPASELRPEGASAPLSIESYEASADFSRLLIYTNSRRVWRRNTRGDYWVLDRQAHTLRKLGGDAPPSSLMFAKLSLSGRHAAPSPS